MPIHFLKVGEGPPLVFFHGYGFDSSVFASLIPKLSLQYTLYLIDLPGFGETPLMDWTTFKEHLLQFLPMSFAVMGWSMGGLFATRLAIEVPHAVHHLVNITSSPCFVQKEKWVGIESQALTIFYEQILKNPKEALSQFLALQTNQRLVLNNTLPSGLQQGLHLLRDWDLRDQLNGLNLPVCYLFGKLDAIVPYKVMGQMQAQYSHFHYHLFKRAAHAPFLSHQDEFLSILLDFLK